jgi:hypothetical protein|tara:strand:- start:353 stop:820 length:468 start_codon:yes stop_codon:yes gene_type:complete
MKKMIVRLAAVVALASMTTFAMAADWNKDQAAVWSVVTQSWEDEVAKNGNWPKDYVHKDVVAWGESWPQPREAASIAKWSRFGEKTDTTLIYELFPVSIVVVGSTAIVNYNTVSVGNNYEGKRERSTQGLIETLVYDGKSWRFLSLTSFEINSDH